MESENSRLKTLSLQRLTETLIIPDITKTESNNCFIILYLLSYETISFGHRHTCISVASSKVLALKSLIPYLGKIIYRASNWTAAWAKKPQHGSKQIRGSMVLNSSGLYTSGYICTYSQYFSPSGKLGFSFRLT